jgi:Kef-type K+ transport system membrane component KefB
VLTGQILLELAVILFLVQILGYLCGWIGQQWVIGEILAGIVLGPSVLGALWPSFTADLFPSGSLPTLQTLGDIGLVLYMFSLGAGLDRQMLLRQSRSALWLTLNSVLLPLWLGAVLALFLYPTFAGPHAGRASFVLLVATAMAITAFPVLARILEEKNLAGTRLGLLGLTTAAMGDVIAWCLLAVVVAVSQAQGLAQAGRNIGLLALFIVAMLGIVRPGLVLLERRLHASQHLIAVGLLLLLLSASATNALGVHPIFGAFLVGIILPRTALFADYLRNIDRVNTGLFLPLYFVSSGLHTNIRFISGLDLWLLCLLVLAVACLGKLLGGSIAARYAGYNWRESLGLGVLLNIRGMVGLIVLNIGLSIGVLSPTLFAMLVLMALATTAMASPLLALLGVHAGPETVRQAP